MFLLLQAKIVFTTRMHVEVIRGGKGILDGGFLCLVQLVYFYFPLVVWLLIVNTIVVSLVDESSTFAAIFFAISPNFVLAEDVSIQPSLESDTEGDNVVGLQKIEDGSVISNIHTSKWRVFTDNGRDFFLKASFCSLCTVISFSCVCCCM